LQAIGAVPGDSRDWEGRHRFFPLDVAAHTNIEPPKYDWFWKYTFWPAGYVSDDLNEVEILQPKIFPGSRILLGNACLFSLHKANVHVHY
jgi:hypothetical protein